MFGTSVTTVEKELQGRIEAIDSEIKHNMKCIEQAMEAIAGHKRQISMLGDLRDGYQALI